MSDIIIEIAKKIKSYGGNLYLVGGAVRDEILKMPKHDEDYSVTGISFDEFKNLFPEAHVRGKDFPVFEINNKEFAIARKERKIGIGHNEFDIEVDKKITIEEDLYRRDITINAIAKEVLTNKIIDPYNGIKDIENRVIRAVSNHFLEDPLRAYRVARFACQLNFNVDNNTIKMMSALKKELSSLSIERVSNELKKVLTFDKPSIFFNILRKSDLLDVHFNEIYKLIGAKQPYEFHPEGDAYNHTMLVLDKVANYVKNLDDERKMEICFAALVHDIGKGKTPKEEYPHHIGHEEAGVELTKNLCNRLKLTSRMKKCGITSCKEHMRGGLFDKMSPAKKVSFIEKIDKTILGLDGLQYIVDADNMKSDEVKINQFNSIGKEIINCINGNEIIEKYNIQSGEKVAQKMHEIRVNYMKRVIEKNERKNN